ncbi:YjbQ family protein [Pectinatus frisingensis]
MEAWPDAEKYLPNGDRRALLNCDAHLKATLLGSSQIFDVDDGEFGAGPTGYVYFVDFDRTRARARKCKVIVLGE